MCIQELINLTDKFGMKLITLLGVFLYSTLIYGSTKVDCSYEANKTTLVKTRNMQSPMWHILTLDKINSLELGNKILCRLVRYNLGSYIDKQLVEALNLPLLNNYFILQNNVEPAEAQTVLTLL